MKQVKRKLAELNDKVNNGKRKSLAEPILLLIAELSAETNNNVKWIIRIACLVLTIIVSTLVTLAVRGF